MLCHLFIFQPSSSSLSYLSVLFRYLPSENYWRCSHAVHWAKVGTWSAISGTTTNLQANLIHVISLLGVTFSVFLEDYAFVLSASVFLEFRKGMLISAVQCSQLDQKIHLLGAGHEGGANNFARNCLAI